MAAGVAFNSTSSVVFMTLTVSAVIVSPSTVYEPLTGTRNVILTSFSSVSFRLLIVMEAVPSPSGDVIVIATVSPASSFLLNEAPAATAEPSTVAEPPFNSRL